MDWIYKDTPCLDSSSSFVFIQWSQPWNPVDFWPVQTKIQMMRPAPTPQHHGGVKIESTVA